MKIETKSGDVIGYTEENLHIFKGIIYAKAKRFMAPTPFLWEEPLDCTKFRSKAPQTTELNEESEEDCLNLNIYTPSINANLPVLVEVHGGAFQNGSNQKQNPYQVIQNDQFVFVTINYRLGVLGYLYQEKYPTSGNNGTLDQLCALEWIKNNIQYFGGNPNQITVLGSSAGAKAISALMGIAKTQELFNQAILISGGYQCVRDIHTATQITNKYIDIIKTNNLQETPLSTLMNAQKILTNTPGSTCMFGPVSDGVVIPLDFFDRFHNGNYWKGKAIIGSSHKEMDMFKMYDPQFMEHIEDIYYGLFGNNASIALKEANEENCIQILSDYMYRTYSYRQAKIMNQNGSFIYQYSTEMYPAIHTFDHMLAFKERNHKIFKSENHILLGDIIRKAYIDFVIQGNPNIENWLPLNQSTSQIIWDLPLKMENINDDDVYQSFGDAVFKL